MRPNTLAGRDLLRQCEQVAAFTHALHRVACMYAWFDLEPYAEEAWRQICGEDAPPWSDIRDFVREAWID